MDAAIELINVSKSFSAEGDADDVVVLDDFSLSIGREGQPEFVVLLGPSGCGKTTILNIVSGLLRPTSGDVRAFGQPIVGPNPYSAMVPQAYTCFPWLTALGNVEFGLAIRHRSRSDRLGIAKDYLDRVGLRDRARAMPRQLSGGMKQRVALARTLAVRPKIMLLDEPFGALDSQTRSEMHQLLVRLWASERNVVLFVTHDITEAVFLADRVILLSPRPPRVVQDLVIDFARPRDPALVRTPEFNKLTEDLLERLKTAAPQGRFAVTT